MAQQLSLSARPHRNAKLFSDHYLDTVLPKLPEWAAFAAEAGPIMRRIAAIFAAYVPSENEAQTERDLVQPILATLGHTFEVQSPLRTPDGTKRPDYVFYRDQATVDAHKGAVLDDTVGTRGAIGIGDAKYWDRPLDVALKGKTSDPFTNKNPSYQISFYLTYSGLEWGLLTNGRLWRLYHKSTAHKFDHFYEVDLRDLATGEDVYRFLYFYVPFRRAAFDPAGRGPTLASLLSASAEYAHAVGEGLKGQVYDAVRLVTQGFLDHPTNGLDVATSDLRVVYDSALITLYRLLFLFYAEARGLLPVERSPAYRDSYSLRHVARDVAGKLDRGETLLPETTTIWSRLQALFGIVNAGNARLGVATYNGGLFDPARHPFLERHAVGDARLMEAIDKLARIGGEFVDYRDLAERHLGTIYEGLLEFHPEALPPDAPDRAAGWTVALLNDKGERKASGSYYTPDWIVQDIIEEAVGPALRGVVADEMTDEGQIAAVLAVNILDPAMGSGHFPVAVTEYIARFMIDRGLSAPGGTGGEADLAYWKRRVAQNCVYGVDLNPLAVELAKLSLWLATAAADKPLSFLDHHLRVGNALVGARLAELRDGVGVGEKARRERERKARLAERGAVTAGQATMLDEDAFRRALGDAVGAMARIEGAAGDTIAEVKEQERLYNALRADLTRRHARLADVAAAVRFGVPVDLGAWRALADYASGAAIARLAQFDDWLDRSATLASRHRFFHWELEFPEIFFDGAGRPLGKRSGFDAVVGNPPYVRQEALAPLKPYLASAHEAVYDGVADLYVYFYHQGLELLRPGGRLSYIVTNKWLRAGYGERLRGHLAANARVERLVDFGHAPVFPDAQTFPCVLTLHKAAPTAKGTALVADFPREALGRVPVAAYVREHGHRVPTARFGAGPWSLESAEVEGLMARIRARGVPLAEFAGVRPLYGLKTGLNEAFLVDTPTRDRLVAADPGCADVIRPYLRGQDVKRWVPSWDGMWILLLKSSGDRDWPWAAISDEAEAERSFAMIYPSLHAYLKPLEHKLRTRQDKGRRWWELRPCAYYDAFGGPKITYQEIQTYPAFGRDEAGYLANNKVFILPTGDPYVLAVLNSPLLWWFNWRALPRMMQGAVTPLGVLMEAAPIARPDDDTRAHIDNAAALLGRLVVERRAVTRAFLGWLRDEFDIATPGRRLEDFAALDADAFVAEARRRRPARAARLGPSALVELRAQWAVGAATIRAGREGADRAERRLAALVEGAYGLTPAEIDLLWRTAPPRMPAGRDARSRHGDEPAAEER